MLIVFSYIVFQRRHVHKLSHLKANYDQATTILTSVTDVFDSAQLSYYLVGYLLLYVPLRVQSLYSGNGIELKLNDRLSNFLSTLLYILNMMMLWRNLSLS